jgi:hypothetical protein
MVLEPLETLANCQSQRSLGQSAAPPPGKRPAKNVLAEGQTHPAKHNGDYGLQPKMLIDFH